jgi:hypothetical protein
MQFLEALLMEELMGVFVGHVGFDGVVTRAATWAVPTGQGGLTTSSSVVLIEGSIGMVSFGGTSASNTP